MARRQRESFDLADPVRRVAKPAEPQETDPSPDDWPDRIERANISEYQQNPDPADEPEPPARRAKRTKTKGKQ